MQGRMKQSRSNVRSCDQPDRGPPALNLSLKPSTSQRSLILSLGKSVTGFRGRGIQGPCLGWLSQPALPAGYPRRSREQGVGVRAGWALPHPQSGFSCRRRSGAQGAQPSRMRTDGHNSAWPKCPEISHRKSPVYTQGTFQTLVCLLDFEL